MMAWIKPRKWREFLEEGTELKKYDAYSIRLAPKTPGAVELILTLDPVMIIDELRTDKK